jgi:hypothetical protein
MDGPNLDMECKYRSISPDFSLEFARCKELESARDDTKYWIELCDEWADGVYHKLASWKPRMVRKFLTVSLFESSGGVYMVDENPGCDEKLTELRQRRTRLESIVKARGKFDWILNLIRP